MVISHQPLPQSRLHGSLFGSVNSWGLCFHPPQPFLYILGELGLNPSMPPLAVGPSPHGSSFSGTPSICKQGEPLLPHMIKWVASGAHSHSRITDGVQAPSTLKLYHCRLPAGPRASANPALSLSFLMWTNHPPTHSSLKQQLLFQLPVGQGLGMSEQGPLTLGLSEL